MCCNAYCIPFAFNAAILFVFVLVAGLPSSNGENGDLGAKVSGASLNNHHRVEEHDGTSITEPAWFGPRLGRKKRSVPLESDSHGFAYVDNDAMESSPSTLEYYILQLLTHYPRVLAADFGSEDQLTKNRYSRGVWPDEERMIQRTPPFSPRLGRSGMLKQRLQRNAVPKMDAASVFKPRLGRSGPTDFSDFAEA